MSAVALLSACGTSREEEVVGRTTQAVEAANYEVSLGFPQGRALVGIALHATESLRLADGVILQDSKGLPASAINLGTGSLEVGSEARAGSLLSGGGIWLRSRSVVAGDAQAAGSISQQDGVVVQGSLAPNTPLGTLQTLGFAVVFPSAVGGVSLEPDQQGTLAPGSYDHLVLKSRAVVSLNAGVWHLNRLQLEPQAKLRVNTTAGPVIIYVRDFLDFKGKIEKTGPTGSFLLGYFGTSQISLEAPFDGTLVAPSAALRLAPVGTPGHRGSFFARQIDAAEARSTITFEPFQYWAALTGLQKCVDAIPRPNASVPASQRELGYQRDIARYCSMPGADSCRIEIASRVNVDYTDAAFALILENVSPSSYLAFIRDRSRKEQALAADSASAQAFCEGADDDLDLVPNDRDACPSTPPLTATFDDGCTDPDQPPAPSAEDMKKVFEGGTIMADPRCNGIGMLPKAPKGGFYWPSDLAKGVFVFASRPENQPAACPLWYMLDLDTAGPGPDGTPEARRYSVVFPSTDAQTALMGSTTHTVPPGIVQFQARPTDAGLRGVLGRIMLVGRGVVKYRLSIMNGNGARSPWSDWTVPSTRSCAELGLNCGG